MTPFYTNLALWVGGLILVSILETGSRQRRNHFPFYSDNCLFRTLDALCRGRIDPGIYCVHGRSVVPESTVCPPGCICVRWYALLLCVCQSDLCNGADLRYIGKALAVVLVILQIPGSSGTYPIEMTPVFFQRLHPLLPFSYGIGAMRECIAGFYKNNYAKDLS